MVSSAVSKFLNRADLAWCVGCKKKGSPWAPFSRIPFQTSIQAWSGKNFARVSFGGLGVTKETTTIAIRVLKTIATTGITS